MPTEIPKTYDPQDAQSRWLAFWDQHALFRARAETAARVRVVIEWRDGETVWGTVGVSENVIEASWLALADAVEYKLFEDEEGVR